jgi:hypothetical protein
VALVHLISTDLIEGRLLRSRLEAEGIPVMQKGGDESPYRLGPIELFVPEEALEDAKEILRAVGSGELERSLDEPEPA